MRLHKIILYTRTFSGNQDRRMYNIFRMTFERAGQEVSWWGSRQRT